LVDGDEDAPASSDVTPVPPELKTREEMASMIFRERLLLALGQCTTYGLLIGVVVATALVGKDIIGRFDFAAEPRWRLVLELGALVLAGTAVVIAWMRLFTYIAKRMKQLCSCGCNREDLLKIAVATGRCGSCGRRVLADE
jgi:hypothetical protein